MKDGQIRLTIGQKTVCKAHKAPHKASEGIIILRGRSSRSNKNPLTTLKTFEK